MNEKMCRKCESVYPVNMFSKHSGTKDKLDNRCKSCVKKVKENCKNNGINKEYPVYELDMNNRNWQLGKPPGSILYKQNTQTDASHYEARISINNKLKSKSFSTDIFDDANAEAIKWLNNISNENNLTRNMIRIIDDTTIEVTLTKGLIMKTDIKFADICQKYNLCSTKGGGNPNAEYYAMITNNYKEASFHKYITGFKMTDHINRDPLDNRLINLRETTYKQNNNNRGPPKKYNKTDNHMLGIRFTQKDECWQARIKQNDKEYTKTFAVKKYGYEEAKQMAIDARKQFNEQFSCTNS